MSAPLRPRIGWKADGDRENGRFGASVGSAGDVNGDGYNDIIVGAPSYGPYGGDDEVEGRAYVYLGSPSGPSLRSDWMAEGGRYEEFGESVATAGDVNGDGYSDVIVGAPYYSNNPAAEGGVFVYYGSASGLSLEPDWTAESNQGGGLNSAPLFGWSVGTAGDVNGDGYDDVIVGAPRYEHGQDAEGSAFVFYGSASGLSLAPRWTAESEQVGAEFAWSVGTAGDVNGDGYDDVIVGAPHYDPDGGPSGNGQAFVYHGSASGLSRTPDWTADEGEKDPQNFGSSVATAGDVNGDGYDDIVIGAYLYDIGQSAAGGAAFAYHGSASGLSLTPDWMAESNQGGAFFGYSLGTAGDVNGDGYDDVIIGASRKNEVFVYKGSASGLSAMADWTAGEHRLGSSVGTAGDVDGDGYDEIIAGAPEHQNGQMNEGGAVIFRKPRPLPPAEPLAKSSGHPRGVR